MRTSSPGPPGRADAAQWRRWVFPAAIGAGLVTLLVLPRGAAPGMALSYTKFLADVSAGMVRAVTISPAGQVTGSLAGGHSFTTTIPVALGGNGLAADLAAHHVQVTATTATSSSLLSVLIGLLPLLLFGGLLYLGIRKVPLSSGGGLGGLGGLAKAKARVIDAERPATRFTDVAGYAAVKTEISEVVDYLRDPGRYHRAGARGPRGVLMAGHPVPARRCSPARSPARLTSPSCRYRARLSWRCSSASERPGSGTCSCRPAPVPRPSCSSTRSMPSVPAATTVAWPAATSGSRP